MDRNSRDGRARECSSLGSKNRRQSMRRVEGGAGGGGGGGGGGEAEGGGGQRWGREGGVGIVI